MKTFDVIVLGCGGFGSSAVFHLARRGLSVLGLDQLTPPHQQGSSHGETRVIRKAYFEHPSYVPLLHRAYELWGELEQRSARELFVRCGLLLAGPADGEVIAGARLSAREHQLTIENLSVAEARQRFPVINVPDGLDVVFEADAGFLRAERCIETHLSEALRHAAVLNFDECVTDIRWSQNSVEVTTNRDHYHAGSLVVTGGAWTGRLLRDYESIISIKRKTLFWLPVSDPRWNAATQSTIHLMDLPEGQFYGFPSIDGRLVKVAEHTGGSVVDRVDNLVRSTTADEAVGVLNYAKRCLNGVDLRVERTSVCMYSMSPDGHFLIDRLSDAPIVVAAGFSGHGFKFTSVLGEAISDLVLTGKSPLPIDFLSRNRLCEDS